MVCASVFGPFVRIELWSGYNKLVNTLITRYTNEDSADTRKHNSVLF